MKNKFALFSCLCALFVLIFASRQVVESCRYGLSLCIELILPSLFPFFLISVLLSRLGLPAWLGKLLGPAAGRLFRVSGAGVTALLIGLSGGYPMGAAYLSQLLQDKRISEREAEHLLGFCNNSGPAFLIGAIGTGLFGSAKLGLFLYSIHITAALLTGLLMRGMGGKPSDFPPVDEKRSVTFGALLPEAVSQTVSALLNVCGFVVCFTVFTGLLNTNGILDSVVAHVCAPLHIPAETLRAMLIGFWELGSGIGALRGLPPTPLNLATAAALVGWGGISVQFQTFAVLADCKIKGTLHTAGRLLSAVFSFLLTYGILLLKT